ncbi:MAG: choice-of-anchor D domain-containing protein [Planctomycetes bacterium]|nr:choice-of-anchor D domain-containing protein [Planctomycetota bacterium]
MVNSHKMLFVLVVFISSILVSCAGEAKKVYVSQTKLDFGNVFLGESKELESTLYNGSDTTISINLIEITGSICFTSAKTGTNSRLIQPKSELTFTVIYTPTTLTQNEATLAIQTANRHRPFKVELLGSGRGFAKIQFSKDKLEFLAVIKNQTLTKSLDIENFGINDLEITKFSMSGVDASLFSVVTGGATPINITPGATHI